MDLIGDERGRLARAASWLEASPAETLGLAALLVAALAATGVLVWSALGRPTLGAAPTASAAAGAGPADGAGAAGEAGEVGEAVDAGDGGGTGDAAGDDDAPDEHAAADPDGDADGSAAGPSGEVTVHVAGAVPRPGVVVLPAGARVTDAVEAAGGLLPDADPARINLARPLEDGEQLLILREGEEAPAAPAGGTSAATSGAGADGEVGPVDLNTASPDQLQTLPGIGPALADRIVAHREQHGPFQAPGDLRDVSGIGEKRFQDLADRITVG